MKIGILGHSFIEWTGGFDFLRIIIESLLTVVNHHDEIHLILPTKGPRYSLLNFARRVRSVIFNRGPKYPNSNLILETSAELGDRVHIVQIDRGDRALARYCKSVEIDVLLPSTFELPSFITTPWVAYIADFQHKHLPHFFTEQECVKRDDHFSRLVNSASGVIVNSRTVADDVKKFCSTIRGPLFVMPFSGGPPRVKLSDFNYVRHKYLIDKNFFMVSNQFWVHKDHSTVFRAFSLLLNQKPELMLVCTGEPSDPRDPEYFYRLIDMAKELGIQKRLKILGLIPKSDQLGLMKGCVAVVQPTLSEGGPGGGVVFDAVGLGIRCIISDIPVNMELVEPTIKFFSAGDHINLADRMSEALSECTPPQNDVSLQIEGFKRRQKCGAVLLEAISYVITHKSRKSVNC